jgi:putative NADH-flavin reductase
MMVLVLGASGATGRLVVQQLLGCGQSVRAIVRSPETFLKAVGSHELLVVENASLLELTDQQLRQHVDGCAAIVSCLGHTLSFKGVYGKPRCLVTEATRRLCEAIKANQHNYPVKFVLMNSTGCRNPEIDEAISFAEKCVVGLISLLLPPHRDNELAVAYLRKQLGQPDTQIEWVAVRPDSLFDEPIATEYELHASPTRSAIFNSGKTSRINVAHFMAELISDDTLWNVWKGKTPVIYNVE